MACTYRLALVFLLAFAVSIPANSQRIVSSDFNKYPSVVSYGVSYEIKDVDTAGVDVLCKIDLNKYEHLRKKNERVEIKEETTSTILVLYSEAELKIIRKPYYTFTPASGRKNE